jgi:mannose-6-phosphate isomerase-like protein (cupin superfamily)
MIISLEELMAGKVLRGEAIAMRAWSGPATIRNQDADEVLYILEEDTGIFLPRGEEMEVDGTVIGVAAGVSPAGPARTPAPTRVRLHDQPVQKTGDRWYRELIQSEITQFVGSIPPGRAPDHFHLYEEMLCILQGSGFLWAGESKTPIARGSCIYLPKKQVHCVENTTSGELRLLGVFYPAGSPSVRYEVHQSADSAPSQRELDRRS